MAYGVVHHVSRAGRKEQYEAVDRSRPSQRRQPPRGADLPRGRPVRDGWTIIAVHESQESWERFRDETLMPTMGAGIEGGFASPPEETGLPDPQPADELGRLGCSRGRRSKEPASASTSASCSGVSSLLPAADRGVPEAVERAVGRGDVRVEELREPSATLASALVAHLEQAVAGTPAARTASTYRRQAHAQRRASLTCANSSRRSGSTQKRGSAP